MNNFINKNMKNYTVTLFQIMIKKKNSQKCHKILKG